MLNNRIPKEPEEINKFRRNYTFNKSWREAFSQILTLENTQDKRVLVPAYIGLSHEEGSGVFDPIFNSKSKYLFYRVDSELNPDLSDFKIKLEVFNPTHVVIINYFGKVIKNRKEISKLVKAKNSAILIEDWAHDLTPFIFRDSIEHLADYELFAPHKILPTKYGGICVSKEANTELVNTAEYDNLLELLTYDFKEISRVRIENFNYLKANLKKLVHIKIMINDTNDSLLTPLNFPIIFSTNIERHEYYMKLIENNIYPTSLYHRLIPQIDEIEFPTSSEISQTILNLPIHQDVTSKDLEKLVTILRGE